MCVGVLFAQSHDGFSPSVSCSRVVRLNRQSSAVHAKAFWRADWIVMDGNADLIGPSKRLRTARAFSKSILYVHSIPWLGPLRIQTGQHSRP